MPEFEKPKSNEMPNAGPEVPQRFRLFQEVVAVVTKRIEEQAGHTIGRDGEKQLAFDEDVRIAANLPSLGVDTISVEFCRLPGFNITEPKGELKEVMDSMDKLLGLGPEDRQHSTDFLLDASRFCWGSMLLFGEGSPLVAEGDAFDPSPTKLVNQENKYWFVLAPEMPPTIVQARPWDRHKPITDRLHEYPRHELTDKECKVLLTLLATAPLEPEVFDDEE